MAYRNVQGRGRVRSENYKLWLHEAIYCIKSQAVKKVSGEVVVVFNFPRKSKVADVSNRVKLAEDLLVKTAIIDDDRFIIAGAHCWTDKSNMTVAHIVRADDCVIDFKYNQSMKAGRLKFI